MRLGRSIAGVLIALAVGLGARASIGLAQPGMVELPIEIAPLAEHASVVSGGTTRLAVRIALPEGYHVQSNQPRDPSLIRTVLWLDPASGITATEIVYPASTDFRIEGFPEPLAVFDRVFVVGVAASVGANVAPGTLRIPARLRVQACDNKLCYRPVSKDFAWTLTVVAAADAAAVPQHAETFAAVSWGAGEPPPAAAPPPPVSSAPRPPATVPAGSTDPMARLDRFALRGSAGGYLNTADFLEFIADADAGVTRAGWFDGRGVLSILAIVFLGGLALNLTPCVLPMIPINLAIIGAGTDAGKRRRGFLLGLAYGSAMAVVYGVLGLVVILTAGTFGTINASPWFNLGIAILFVFLALAMFDVITIDFSRFSSRIRFKDASRGTFMLAFGMGAIAALLAGACVAPVVIQVVLFASDLYARGTAIALALPFFLGLGMALPWPIAGAGMASLPRPGAWMVRVKQVFGLFILATALYYGYLAYGLFADRWVDPATVSASIDEQVKSGWYSSLEDGLRVAEQRGTPVLIDMWATWCKNCLTMDRTTLVAPDVQKALEGYTKIKMQAEDLDAYPASELMRRIRQYGLPAYAIYYPTSSPAGQR